MIRKQIDAGLAIADQPSRAELAALKSEGYTGVVNLRNDGEPEQPLGTAEEGQEVRALGMDYLHSGVGGAPLTEALVESVRAFLAEHATQKVLVHCRKGGRAAAMVLLDKALKERWSPAEAIAKGRALGLEVDGNLRLMVESYLHDHQANP